MDAGLAQVGIDHAEVLPVVMDRMHLARVDIDAACAIADHRIVLPRAFPQFVEDLEVLIGVVVAIVVLELKEFLVPSPLAVFNALFSPETAAQYQWWTHIGTTLGEILAAFVFTAVFGFVLALLITWSDIVRGIAMPVIAVFNSLPKIALAPLFLIWFGYGFTANVTIAILVAFFPVVLNTTTGLDDVDEDLLDLVRYLHASKLQVFRFMGYRTRLKPYMRFAWLKPRLQIRS